jgi:hypothetical protein
MDGEESWARVGAGAYKIVSKNYPLSVESIIVEKGLLMASPDLRFSMILAESARTSTYPLCNTYYWRTGSTYIHGPPV